MDSRAAIKASLDCSDMLVTMYLSDLEGPELLKRPAERCNHIAWQLGHLILSEHQMIGGCLPGAMPNLPTGFEQRYAKDQASSDHAGDFDDKETLWGLYRTQRAATLVALSQQTDEDFDRASPESIQAYAPTLGSAFVLIGIHWTMHAGQWVVLRRQLGRPPIF